MKNFAVLKLFIGIFSKVEFVSSIQSLLKNLDNPVRITAMICWNYSTRIKFTSRFLKSKYFNEERSHQFAITESRIENFPQVIEEHQQLIIVDLDCKNTQKLLQDVGYKITRRFKWIALSEFYESDHKNLKEILNKLPILTNSEFYCVLKTLSNKEETSLGANNRTEKEFEFSIFQVIAVYKPALDKSLIFENLGIFANNILFVQRKVKELSIRRRNLQQTKLRASLVVTNNDTFKHLEDYRNRHIDTISKVCYFLTNYLSDFVNGTLEYKFVNSWGYKDENTSKWSGMIGDLTENRSDIGASALFYTPDRIKYIDYIAMPTPTRSKFVFRSPKLSFTENVYLLPFDRFVWYSLFGLMAVTSIVLLSVTWIERKIIISDNQIENDSFVLRPSLLDVFIVVFGASCQQGSAVAPMTFSARLVMMLTFITLMFLYTSYSANIVALLQSPSNRIKTLEDLLNSRLKLAADDTVFNHYYFRHATEETRKAIYEKKILNHDGTENFLPIADGIEKIRNGLFAFHFETGVGYKLLEELFLEDEKCGLQEIQYLQVVDPWYSIQKNSSYRKLFKIGMMRINEHGLQQRENFALYTRKPKCVSRGGNFITASLVDTKPTLLVLLWGYLIAFIILLIERILHKIHSKIQNYLQ
ncbi:ionotropic receptor 75a-like [Condylostylus longicornis]|uniref:ionotropic receptor 75a-like n=1 Tax=Condylostylus longicornis TaxID=2530218 RepID=UPI00244DE67B|nr:ionotropic receptor 75a-like [Condylostylus longicornis]